MNGFSDTPVIPPEVESVMKQMRSQPQDMASPSYWMDRGSQAPRSGGGSGGGGGGGEDYVKDAVTLLTFLMSL